MLFTHHYVMFLAKRERQKNNKYIQPQQIFCKYSLRFLHTHRNIRCVISEINQFKVTTIELYMGSSLANGHYHLLFNFSQNVCHLADEAKATAIASIVRPLWEAHTNIPFGCPIQAVSIHNLCQFHLNFCFCVFVAALLLFVFVFVLYLITMNAFSRIYFK